MTKEKTIVDVDIFTGISINDEDMKAFKRHKYYVKRRESDPDFNKKGREQARKQREANPEKYREIDRRSALKAYRANPTKFREYNKNLRNANPGREKGYGLKKAYNISLDDYNQLLEVCESRCEICGNTERLVPDHNHNTGMIRGILCSNCNAGLGLLGDNMDGILHAFEYLYLQEYE